MKLLLFLCSILQLLFGVHCSFGIVRVPFNANSTATPVVLLFAGGSSMSPSQYMQLFDFVQTSAASFNIRLWIGFPKFWFNNWATQSQFEKQARNTLTEVAESLNEYGVFDLKQVRAFYGGQLAGGMAMQNMIEKVFNKPFPMQTDGQDDDILTLFTNGGMILFSSALQRKYIQGNSFLTKDYPILSLSGELDGMFRIFRLAESFYHDNQTMSRYSLVVPGANYMSFSTGNSPISVWINDFPAEVDKITVQTQISSLVVSFLVLHTPESLETSGRLDCERLLARFRSESHEFFKPILQSLELEGSYHLKPPCSDLKHGNKTECWTGSKWSEYAQAEMASLHNKSLSVSVKDEFWKAWIVYPFHHPEILDKCDNSTSLCNLHFVSVSECVYAEADNGRAPVSCSELRGKMTSRQNAHLAAGEKNATFVGLDDNNKICREINAKAIEWALKHSGEKTLKRYLHKGRKIEVGDDLGPYNGGRWIWENLRFNGGKNSTVVVRSPTMRTPLDYFVPIFRGFHYCKLLTPARVLEWIYFDSLK